MTPIATAFVPISLQIVQELQPISLVIIVPGPPLRAFNPEPDLHAIHQAFEEAMASANVRDERMPSSAAAFRERAAIILSVRNKILATLPEKHRQNYPPF